MKKTLWLILILGFGLRLTAVSFGLPHLYHADEPIIVNHALAYGTGDLNPHFFKIPPLVSYMLFFCYGIFFAAGRLTGEFSSVQDFEFLFYSDPSAFYIIARFVFGVLLGTLTIAVLYRLVRKHFDEQHAWASALLFAVCFLHVRDSHYVYADIPLIFVMVLTLDWIMRLLDKPKAWTSYWKIAFGIGLATAIKYNGFSLLVPFAAAAILARKQMSLPKALSVPFGAAAVFILFNPYALLDYRSFTAEVLMQGEALSATGWIHHFRYSLAGAGGALFLAAGVLGLLLALSFQRNRKQTLFAVYALFYYYLVSTKGQHYDRYVLPLMPVLAFFAAHFALALANKIYKAQPGLIFAVLILLIAAPSLTRCLLWNRIMLHPDTRDQAKLWIESQVPAGSRLALDWDFYMPRLSFTPEQLAEKKSTAHSNPHFSAAQRRKLDYFLTHPAAAAYALHFLQRDAGAERPFLFSTPVLPYDLETLKKNRIQYVMIADFPRSSHQDAAAVFRDSVRSEANLLKVFSAYKNPQRPIDRFPLTGGPFLWEELWARKSNGYTLELYELPPA